MQVLKDNIREAIIDSAKEEFVLNGYKGSSMRKIAGKVNITVGNLYRYFKNKDELFHYIVTPVYKKLIYFLKNHRDMFDDDKLLNMNFDEIVNTFVALIISMIKKYKTELLILANGAEGTEYSNAKKIIIEILKEHAYEHFTEYFKEEDDTSLNHTANAFSISFIEGLVSIIQKSENENILYNSLKLYINIQFGGFIRFM